MSWTETRVGLLTKLWADGLTASQVAVKLGGFEHCKDGGRNAVIGIIHRMGLSSRAKKNPSTSILRSRKLGRQSNGANLKSIHLSRQSVNGNEKYDEIMPAKLNGPVIPLHKSAAFPKAGEYGLTESELISLASLYKQV